MGIDLKYGRVTLENSTIGEDEPVIVFRAQDMLLPKVLLMYRVLCALSGSPQRHLDAIDRTMTQIEAWQQEHFTKVPTSDQLA